MLEITITVHCPELSELAAAIAGKAVSASTGAHPTKPAAPTYVPDDLPWPSTAPEHQTIVPTQPVQEPPTAATPAAAAFVPTAAPSYDVGQLTRAGAELAQAGRMPDLLALLQQFGVQAVTQLKPEQHGAFATALRGLGARL